MMTHPGLWNLAHGRVWMRVERGLQDDRSLMQLGSSALPTETGFAYAAGEPVTTKFKSAKDIQLLRFANDGVLAKLARVQLSDDPGAVKICAETLTDPEVVSLLDAFDAIYGTKTAASALPCTLRVLLYRMKLHELRAHLADLHEVRADTSQLLTHRRFGRQVFWLTINLPRDAGEKGGLDTASERTVKANISFPNDLELVEAESFPKPVSSKPKEGKPEIEYRFDLDHGHWPEGHSDEVSLKLVLETKELRDAKQYLLFVASLIAGAALAVLFREPRTRGCTSESA